MNNQDTPETDAFYSTFADGLAVPTQEEWLDRLKRYERERNELRADLKTALQWIDDGDNDQEGRDLIVGPMTAKYFSSSQP